MRPLPLLVALLGLAAHGCGGDPPAPVPARWEVLVSASAPEAVRLSAEDARSYLAQMGRRATLVVADGEARCAPDRGRVVVAGDGLADPVFDGPATEQTFRYEERRCDGGRLYVLSGGGLLGRQYAVYEWLHALGVRFFHPEQEWVPDAPELPDEAMAREHTPAFPVRSVSLHLTHPLELGDAFRLGDERYAQEARRYIDWQLKNGASRGHGGVGAGALARWGRMRGFPSEGGINLHNAQQGGRPVVDPDDPRPEEEQIAEAIEAVMTREDAPSLFSFQFNPSEFTEIPDVDALRQITFVADYMAERYPGVDVFTINHGTAGEPTATYGLRYFDLPQLAPPNLGVKVHTLMFYDLERPAPVYGNEDFRYLYDFMEREHVRRKLWYFPEAAWWLTFDIAVPLYLPITIEARDRDLQRLAHMLEGGLEGHHVFGTGHEWGYWQNEYCAFRMATDLAYRWQDCVRDIAHPLGDAAAEVAAVVEEAVAHQQGHFFDAEAIRWLVGTDPETELAASIGVDFHPLPPSPAEIMRWDAAGVARFRAETEPRLASIAAGYFALAARLTAVEPLAPPRAAFLLREIRDGLEANALRARHAQQLYGAVVDLRDAQLTLASPDAARARLDTAAAITARALEVIHRREADYRYLPLARSVAGGADGTQDENWTIYRYRYLNRTHHGYYYTRPDELAREVFEGARESIWIEDALLSGAQPLSLRVLDADLTSTRVAFGDGIEETGGPLFVHDYALADTYDVAVSADRAGAPFAWSARVAELLVERSTGFSGRVLEPAGAELIEGVMPGLVFGPIDDGRAAIGFAIDPSGRVSPALWSEVAREATPALLETAPATLVVPIVNRAAGAVHTTIRIEDATLLLTDEAASVVLEGRMPTEGVIDAVVAIGGFDRPGARMIVASTLGYTPDALPVTVPFRIAYTLE